MNISKISRAIGLACTAMVATSAFALPASSYSAATTRNIFISGASAQDNGILSTMLQECVSGSLHRYAISNNFAYLCQPAASLNVGGGLTQVAVYKIAVGGSGNGVAPVNFTATTTASPSVITLPFLDFTKIAASCTNVGATAALGTLTQTYVNVACTASSGTLTTGAQSRIGLSDVEPAFFAPNSQTSLLTTKAPIATLIFGVPVSRNIYLALQAQQGLNVGDCTNTASSTSVPVWEYSNQCMPSLTQSQLVSAYTKANKNWADIGVVSGLVDDKIYVARRVDSSGTQKTFEALVARTPNGDGALKSCQTLTDGFVAPDTATVTGDVFATACGTGPVSTVFSGSGGGDVRSCMTTHHANGRGAIGILTAEDIASATTNWRFVKVNGAAPTHADVASGAYQFWTVPTINFRTDTANAALTTGLVGYTGASGFIARLRFQLRDPVGLAIAQPFGPSGLMANWDLQGNPALPLDFTGLTGVNPWGRKVGGSTLNNCQMGVGANL